MALLLVIAFLSAHTAEPVTCVDVLAWLCYHIVFVSAHAAEPVTCVVVLAWLCYHIVIVSAQIAEIHRSQKHKGPLSRRTQRNTNGASCRAARKETGKHESETLIQHHASEREMLIQQT